MIEIDKIYNMDCLEGMRAIPDGSVDCIICDLPYGTMKGFGWRAAGQDTHRHDWDVIIPTDKLFEQYVRVLRRNGAAVLFSQEPYTSHLRTFHQENMVFCYPMIWKKNVPGNCFNAKTAPVGLFEDINVFRKYIQIAVNNPLRDYFRKLIEFMPVPKTDAVRKLGSRAQHCFNVDGNQFALCTAETYSDLVSLYSFDKMEGFKTYEELKQIDEDFKAEYVDPDETVFNLPEGASVLPNVLEFAKDADTFHPTQKPVALIRRLIQTYSNEGDTILDNCMGSGTTAIACIREKRHFIGFELNKEFYDKACKRIQRELQQLTLF